jgi:NADH-ubiquinone oxidoreductase chain 6
METLFLLVDNYTNGYNVEFLAIVSFIAILCGIFVIISKNPIISVLFLIGLFICISSYLIFLGMYFIGLSYLLVYIGAVSILFLFILMLINVRISELQAESSNSIPLSIIISICLFSILYEILPTETTIDFINEYLLNNLNIYNIYTLFYKNEYVPYVISQI